MNYLGDFAEDSTIRIALTTNNGDGAAVAPSSAFEEADFRIYKNGSATEKTSTNGVTIASPFDSVTGLHTLEIDTSNDTGDTGFWTTGADYWVVAVPDETVDSQTVVAVIATFSIENRLRVKATDEVSANVTKIAGASVSTTTAQLGVNVVNAGGTAWGSGAITAAAIASNAITSAKIATDAIGSAQLAASAVGEIADGVYEEAYAGHQTPGTYGFLWDKWRKSNPAITGEVTSAVTATTTTFSTDITGYANGAFENAVLIFINGSTNADFRGVVSGYIQSNGVVTITPALPTPPVAGDEFTIAIPSFVYTLAEVQSGLATTTQLTTVEGKIDGIDGVTDKLDTTLEVDGLVYRFTTNALEQAPSGGGGGSTVVVTPLVAQTPVRAVGTNIETFIGDLSDIDVSIFSGEDPVDLSALGNLEVCVQAKNGVDLDLVEMADLTISGTGNETISWTPNGPSVSDVGRFKWSLRIASTKQVIAYGAWIVVDAALSDAS